MNYEQLAVGVEVWVVRRYENTKDCSEGPLLVAAFDREMVYVIGGTNFGEFFKAEELFESREAAEESLERRKKTSAEGEST